MHYVRLFPRLSEMLGYESAVDVKAEPEARITMAGTKVTLCHASVCPFCPIVKKRLQR